MNLFDIFGGVHDISFIILLQERNLSNQIKHKLKFNNHFIIQPCNGASLLWFWTHLLKAEIENCTVKNILNNLMGGFCTEIKNKRIALTF